VFPHSFEPFVLYHIMPLLIPVYTEPEEAEEARRFYYTALFSTTVQREETDTLLSAVEVTREGEDAVLNAAADIEAGDSVPVVIDLVSEDLR
jgi:hypothetical protein